MKTGRCGAAPSLSAWLKVTRQLGSGFVSRLTVIQLKNNENLPGVNQLSVNLAETQEENMVPSAGNAASAGQLPGAP